MLSMYPPQNSFVHLHLHCLVFGILFLKDHNLKLERQMNEKMFKFYFIFFYPDLITTP